MNQAQRNLLTNINSIELFSLLFHPNRYDTVHPGENLSLVVNNNWGMFNPSWDYPVGHPGNSV